MVGVIKVEVSLFLECDVEDAEAKASVEAIGEHLDSSPIEGVFISHVEVKDQTDYEE